MNQEQLFFNVQGCDFLKKNNIDIEKMNEHFNFKFDLNLDVETCLEFDDTIEFNKRKNTGSYYTPDYMAEYMVNSVLIDYFLENFDFDKEVIYDIFVKKNKNNYKSEMLDIMETLYNLKIVDLSSGTGIFLFEYIKIIIELLIDTDKEIIRKIIENNIYAFDINKNALNILELKMNELYFKYDNTVLIKIKSFNINSITDDLFLNYIPIDGFDIVIGNPPYLGEKGNKELFNEIKKSKFGNMYYEGKMDLFYYFIYRGIKILKDNGILIYLTTNYFVTADGAKKLRNFLYENGNFIKIVNFNTNKIFKAAAGQHSMIFTYSKKDENTTKIINLNKKVSIETKEDLLKNEFVGEFYYEIFKKKLYSNNGTIRIFINNYHYSIIEKIEIQSNLRISDCFNVNQGFISGADKVSKNSINKKISYEIIKKYNINIDDSIFVLDENEIERFKDRKYLKKLYKNSDVMKFSVKGNTDKYVLYVDDCINPDNELINHLTPFMEILKSRREVKNNIRKWYSLQWPRDEEIFNREKIVAPQRNRSNVFGYSNGAFYGSADIYYITAKETFFNYDLKILLGLINSKLFYLYLSNIGKKKGNELELYATPLKKLLIKEINNDKVFLEIVNRLILDFNITDFNLLDTIIYKEYNLTENEIKFIENYYERCHNE